MSLYSKHRDNEIDRKQIRILAENRECNNWNYPTGSYRTYTRIDS